MSPLQSVPRLLYILIGVLVVSWLTVIAAIVTQDIAAERTARDMRLYHLPVMRASSQISRDLLVIQGALILYRGAVEQGSSEEIISRYRLEAAQITDRVTSVIELNVETIIRVQRRYGAKQFEKSTARLEAAWNNFQEASHKSSSSIPVAGRHYGRATELFLIRAIQMERLHGDPEEQLSTIVIEQQGRVRSGILLALALLVLMGAPLSYWTAKSILKAVLRHDEVLSLLAEREVRMAEAQRIGHIGSWEWDIPNDKVSWSDENFRIYSLAPQEVTPTYEMFMEYVHPDDRARVDAAVRAALDHDEPYVIEHRIILANDVVRILREKAEVFRDELGDPVKMVGTVQDITERKQAEEEVRELNRTLEITVEKRTAELQGQKDFSEMILNTAGEGIYGVDLDGNCTFINPAACDMLGMGLIDVLGRNSHELFHHSRPAGDAYPVAECHIYRAFQEGKVTTVNDEVFWRQDGSSFSVEYTSTPIIMEGKIKGAVVVFWDITESRNLQAQLVQSSKLATLGEMATGVAHELNQPLNVIRLAAGNVLRRHERDKLDPVYMAEKLKRIESQTVRATAIIDHMRIFGRKADGVPQVVDLNACIESTLYFIGQQTKLAKIDIVLDLAEDGVFVTGHAVQIEQVCLNLINNARDAIAAREAREPAGKFAKTIRLVTRVDADQDKALLSVIDSGGGMPADILVRVFEPFFTTKEIGKGTGLGLSISFGIITEMNGEISARNSGEGADFTITLPNLASGAKILSSQGTNLLPDIPG